MAFNDVSLGRAVLALVTDPTALRAGMATAKDEAVAWTRSAQKSLAAAGAQLDKTGQAMTLGITLPVLAAGKAIVDTGADFERTLGQIVGLTDVTGDEIDGIRKKVLALGADVGKTPQELAEAFYFVASAGFTADEAMEVLETSAIASAAGLGRTQDVAKVLGLTINAYGHENITAARAADILTAAVKDGTAEADAFAGVLGRVVPTAATLGVGFDQVTGALAAMTLTGLSADEAATSLNQVLVSLLKPTNEAEDAIEAMGLSSQGLRDQLREKGLLDTLRTLEERFAGNDEAASQVFGNVRALRGVLALLALDSDQLNGVFADTAGALGDLAEGYEETETPAREFARSQAELDATLIDLSTDVLPVVVDIVRGAVGFVRDLVDGFKGLPEPVRQGVVQFLAMAAALGPILLIGGKLLTAVSGLWLGLDKLAVLLVTKLVPGFTAAKLAGGPLLLLMLAIIDAADKLPKAAAALDSLSTARGAGDFKGQAQALRDYADSLPGWIPLIQVTKDEIYGQAAALDAQGVAAAAAAAQSTTWTDEQQDAIEAARIAAASLPPVAQAYKDTGGSAETYAATLDKALDKALAVQSEYTKGALKALVEFRSAIESAYSTAQDSQLDFERTTVAIATKQAELAALDEEWTKHHGEMTKLQKKQWRLRKDEALAELSALRLHLGLIGDEITQTATLKSLLASDEMKKGLTSKFPETQAAYRALRDDALAKLQEIGQRGGPAAKTATEAIAKYLDPSNPLSPLNEAGGWGSAAGTSYIKSLADAVRLNTWRIQAALRFPTKLLTAASPPTSPDNPLHRIDEWGASTGEAWLSPFVSVIEGAVDRLRGPLAAMSGVLHNPFGAPAGLAMAAAGAGIGYGGQARTSSSTLADAAGPTIVEKHYHLTVQGLIEAESKDDVLRTLQRLDAIGRDD